ncbi:polysaccharide biosynthesis tyrosine autokinase [Sodalis sp. RH20]|uniref:polysaccharide biosynthesis tyrosine autokinase n=1 Tax=unclassified Sodalis (in: enterobacteria) TaxID=2636512 RepID=UPI0039B5828F
MIDKNKPALSIGNSDEIDIGRIVGTLVDGKWLIVAITLLFAALSLIYILITPPTYRSDAVIQVEKDPQASLLDSISAALPNAPPTSATEIQLMLSRMVIGKTINDLNLDTTVTKNYLPVIGYAYAKIAGDTSTGPAISIFQVPDTLLNKPFTLKVANDKEYILTDGKGSTVIHGIAGQAISGQGITILVDSLNDSPNTEYTITKRPFLSIYNGIVGVLNIADKGLNTGVLGLSYDNTDPARATVILESISENYVLQNITRKTEVAAKSLAFINQQLPQISDKLNTAENKLNDFRRSNDSVDLSIEAKSVLDTIVQLDGQINELTFKETDISKLYTPDHPAYRALLEKKAVLLKEKERLNKRVESLPQTQQDILRLNRDVQVNQQVYMQLLNRQQELNIAKASAVGSVRIIDPAVTRLSPVAPQKMIILLVFIILGAFLSSAYLLVRRALHKGIEGPEALEANGINVYSSIPLSEWQKNADKKVLSRGNKDIKSSELLATGNPTDLAIEAIRSLRTSLHFAMMEAKNKTLMISGISPGIGKSFISSNLAAVLAQAGQKVLLIDADMRKGYLHSIMNVGSNNKGLSNLLSGQFAHTEVLYDVPKVPGLSVIPRGQIPPNPSELLMNKRMQELLEWADSRYDIVIVDTPPVLAVTDAGIIGSHCGTTLLVARFEENTVKQVEVSIRRLEQNGIETKGVILNAIVRRAYASYGNDNYGYYQYSYESKKD